MIRRIALVLVCATLAACGGGSSSDTPSPSGGGSVNVTAPPFTDPAKCSQAARALGEAAAAIPRAVTGQGGDVTDAVRQLSAVAAAAPEELRDDLEVIADGYNNFAKALEDAGFDPSGGQPPTEDQLKAVEAASKDLQTDEFKQALNNITAWFAGGCQG